MKILLSLLTLFQSILIANEPINEIEIPIIMYHHIQENEDTLNEFMVTPEKFEKDISVIEKLEYTPISYKELCDFVYSDAKLPSKPIIITFDDGYESNYIYAYPILKQFNMKAAIAVIGNMVGKDSYNGVPAFKHFTYSQAKEMYESGLIEIQTHTYDMHNISKRVGIKKIDGEDVSEYKELIKNDILKSSNELSENLGTDNFVFTYPFGAYDDLTEELIKELGYKISVTTDPGTNVILRNIPETLYKLKRYDIKNDTDLENLLNNI